MTNAKIEHLKSFISSLQFEIGYPCIHRELKNYIDDDNIRTWRQLHNLYLQFPVNYGDNDKGSTGGDNSSDSNSQNSDTYSTHDDKSDDGTNESDVTDPIPELHSNNKLAEGYIVKQSLVPKTTVLTELLEQLSVEQRTIFKATKICAFGTWYKYKKICYPNISLTKLKEDVCDTCMKYELMLQDDKLTVTEKEELRAALKV